MTFVIHYDILGYSDTVYIHVSQHIYVYIQCIYDNCVHYFETCFR